MNKNHLKILTAGILSTVLLGASTPAIALETATQNTEPDQPVSISNTQQDAPRGLDRIDQRTLPLDGTFTTEPDAGKGVSIYIVDNGIRASHDDFGGRVAKGYDAVNDGNETSDCTGHGTHVAGIAAGTTYGVAKSATIIPVRVSNCNSDSSKEDIIEGLRWIIEHHQEGTPAVVNMSIGGPPDIDKENAVNDVIADGITFVAAAGNADSGDDGDYQVGEDPIDACNITPAKVPNVITVAASTYGDQPWAYSNFGKCVDIYAPGYAIMSAGHTTDTEMKHWSGTSMASPHVAGAAAVILSRKPTLTPAQVTAEIMNTSTEGILTNIPSGTPNRLLFLSPTTAEPMPDVTAPWSPMFVVASQGNSAGQAKVQWAQGNDGGSAITSQKIHIYENDIKRYTVNVGAQTTSLTVTGLPQGRTFTFAVTATNAIGTSPESERSQPVKIPSATATAPAAPSNVTASEDAGIVTINWDLGADGGSPLTSQRINAYKDDILVKSIDVAVEENYANIDGFEDGQAYTFSVTATNAIGTSPESTRTAPVTIIIPTAPTNARAYASAKAGSANVYWDSSIDNRYELISYEITVYNDELNVVKKVKVPASYKSAAIPGLYNGTYYMFAVEAITSEGRSAESNISNSITPIAAAPGTATNVRAVAGDNNATIYWTRGSENGAPLTSQIVTVYSGATKIGTVTISGSYSSLRMTGLTEGREYQFTITEVNKIGSSPESAKSDIVTPI